MTTLTAPAPGTNGHQPHVLLPIWTSRDADAEIDAQLDVDQSAAALDRPAGAATLKAVAPLVVVNSLAVYGQLAYALEHIAPVGWVWLARIALSIGFAAAVESVALYVGWHAHDALLLKSHATARSLRRWSFAIAAAVAAMNYAHFAAPGMRPTAAACAFGLLSLLSPWMWGLHTRRAARLQLLKERKVDEGGAEFSSERRRNFPIRTWQARRWSIDHGVTDPRAAWEGYNGERSAHAKAKAAAKVAQAPTIAGQPTSPAHGETPTGPAQKRPAHRAPGRKRAQPPRRQPNRRAAQPSPTSTDAAQPTTPSPVETPTPAQPTAHTPTPSQPMDGVSDLQRQRLADLVREFPRDLPGRDKVMAHMREHGYEGWSSKGPAQTLIDLLRAQRESAQPTAQEAS